ncbi:hypothetical protein RWV98_05540 [Agathobaculum sp. NTUH-O15-33]|uniref:hypothetical protein n=1 Tax=Agathobaculum sp. NTUH-O15-33 TaxID=3079302 RepID=UPI0029587A6D|nr:hypothetical protein [Agathobaculum sp. NTUH-O15-33]WNX85730.1 hypothetical protein RWV98_05540 [Agathobaculum sp. NTUH-O15-33]
MIIETRKIGGVTIETADDAFAGLGPEEIRHRHEVFDRTLRETLLQIQRDSRADEPRKSG